jgi:hypothetical protein
MSRVQLSRLIKDVQRQEVLREQLQTDPESVVQRYDLTPQEREAFLNLDAQQLIDLGVNPLLMRTLLVINGVGNADLYTHNIRLTSSARS